MSEPELPPYRIGFFRGGSPRTLPEIGQRASRWLKGLGQWEPALQRWFHIANSLKASLAKPVDASPKALTEHLTRSFQRDRRQVANQTWVDYWVWTPLVELGEGRGVGTNFCMGVTEASRFDRCLLQLRSEGLTARRLLQTGKLIELCALAARTWELSYGWIVPDEYADRMPEALQRRKDPTGWMIYLSRRRGRIPALPAPVRVVPVDDLGSIVVVTEEPFRPDNPEHVERADRVFERLDCAGLMDKE
jgi:hypothetical protein